MLRKLDAWFLIRNSQNYILDEVVTIASDLIIISLSIPLNRYIVENAIWKSLPKSKEWINIDSPRDELGLWLWNHAKTNIIQIRDMIY